MRSEIRRGNWRPICRGAVLTRPERITRADLAAVGIWLGGPTSALSGWDALRTVALGDRQPPASPVLVLSSDRDNRAVEGLVVRRTGRAYARSVTGPDTEPYSLTPVVHIARAVCDAALAYQTFNPVRALVTSAVQRRRCTPDQLSDEYRAGPRAESLFLRLAIDDVLDGARSIAEAVAARKLTRPGIPPFELNIEFVDPSGVLLRSPDIYWRELRAVLEVDSRTYHRDDAAQWHATMARHNYLARHGFAVTHYPPAVINAPSDAWLWEVADWLRRRARELRVPLPAGQGPRRGGSPVVIK
ncbi:MAG: hypothetical protein JWQ77_893 [Jatrophihabitans sp.]|nr:hypothetical protein [Jatrophihabitans sp.]